MKDIREKGLKIEVKCDPKSIKDKASYITFYIKDVKGAKDKTAADIKHQVATFDLAAMSKITKFPVKAEFIPMVKTADTDVATAEKTGVKKPYLLPGKADAKKEIVGNVGIALKYSYLMT